MTAPENFNQVPLEVVSSADEGGGEDSKVVPFLPRNFKLKDGGIWYEYPPDDEGRSKAPVWCCVELEIVAETRAGDGKNWGKLLRWKDRDGRQHEWAMPSTMLAGDGTEYRKELLYGGLAIADTKAGKEKLNLLLLSARLKERATAVARVGWHDAGFVLPDETIGAANGERLLLQTENPLVDGFEVRGDVEQWRAAVGKYLPGNSRLIFAASAALAAPLLHLVNEESGGVNFVGASSIGKSTAAIVAASLCGGPCYVRQWRATANGLEGVAAGHCDLLLVLDELGQINSHEAAQVAYMLANGAGKSRANKSGAARAAARWRSLFLSTGEITLGDKIAEDGRRRIMAGQAVRCLDVPADAGAGFGLFENLHGAADGDSFARMLKAGAAAAHGAPIRKFIAQLIANKADLAVMVKERKEEFAAEYLPQGADGQVSRAAGRFGLVAAAGELGATFEILPITAAEAIAAAASCFRAWIAQRGGSGAAEVEAAISRVARFIEQHGESRFTDCVMDGPDMKQADEKRQVVNRAGFRIKDGEGVMQFYFLSDTWRGEVCAGMNPATVNKALIAAGFLHGADNSPTIRRRLPGIGQARCYHVSGNLLARGGEDGSQ